MNLTTNKQFICKYCNGKFTKEKTLSVHICEQKRRALAQHEKHVILAFDAYTRFYNITQQSTIPKTYEDFCRSPYYNGFVKFGSFVSNVNPLYPDYFIDFVVRSGVKLDHWCRDELYENYVVDLIKKESVETALQRSINQMIEWAENNQAQWNHYFLYVSTSRAMYDIKDGKISPWLVLNCNSGKELLKKFNDEQLEYVSGIIDLPFWMSKFKKLPADVEFVKQVVRESKI